MKRFAILALVVAIVLPLLSPVKASAQVGTTTWTASPSPSAQTKDVSRGYPTEPIAFSTTSIVTGTATSNSTTLTPLAGRKTVRVRLNAVGELWVSIGTTTAVVSGSNCVLIARQTVSTPTLELAEAEKVFTYDAGVPMGYIASTAFSYTIIQEGRRYGQP